MKRLKRFSVPEWAKDAVWYQIFPERFRNGTTSNDPTIEDITDHPVPGWRVSPWGMDWYGRDSWEAGHEFFRSVYLRRFGGDLVGVREKLGYLQDLGINAIYLNPVFQAQSLHKYDATCMHHIDPTFGPDRAGDLRKIAAAGETEDPASWVWTEADLFFVEFLAEAHARGIRVIIDGVFNHTGRAFFAFQDLLKHGKASRYRDWFQIKKWVDDRTFEYDGWFGHKSLPELARTKTDLVPPVREYIFNITRKWMDPKGNGTPGAGIDGWRLDVAFCVPHGFWRAWRRLVKSVNPEAYVTAEIVARADDYLKGDEFDAVMNYMWMYPTVNFFAPSAKAIGAREFRREQDAWRTGYRPECVPVLQNLLDSHDVGRVASMLENLDEPIREFGKYFEFSRIKHAPSFRTGKPGPKTWKALRQAIVFQMTFTGAPMLYYGTEVGMWGGNDPCDRQPMLWDDIVFEPESATATGTTRRVARKPDAAMLRFVRKAIALRHAEPALRRGSFRWLPTGDERVLGFERALDGRVLHVYFNTRDTEVVLSKKQTARDLWVGGAAGCAGVCIKPRGWKILAIESRSSGVPRGKATERPRPVGGGGSSARGQRLLKSSSRPSHQLRSK